MEFKCSPLLRGQIIVFVVGWLGYASTYFLRKPLGVIKADLESDLKISKAELGWLDTALFLPYAVIQVLLGPLGDKFGPRRTYACCMLIAGASMITFGQFSSFPVFFLFLFINGAAQQTQAMFQPKDFRVGPGGPLAEKFLEQ